MESLKKSRLDYSRRCSEKEQAEQVLSEQIVENCIWESSYIYEAKRVDACPGGEIDLGWN
jgi:hypothetical protein